MFDVLDSIKTAILAVFGWTNDIFSNLDAWQFIVPLSIIGIFISFVMLNRVGLLSRFGSSDKAKKE